MDSLIELQRRKAELQVKIEQQRTDLKETFSEIREEIEPAELLKKAVLKALGFSRDKPHDPQKGFLGQLPPALSFIADLFIKDPKWTFVLKWLAPKALKLLNRPKKQAPLPEVELAPDELMVDILQEPEPGVPVKSKIYGGLRRGVSSLRSSLRKPAEATDETIKEPEN